MIKKKLEKSNLYKLYQKKRKEEKKEFEKKIKKMLLNIWKK